MTSQNASNYSFSIHSQTMGIDGGINQDAVARLFGKGAEEQWAVFFREVYQNSADAVNADEDDFEFQVRTGRLGSKAASLISETMGANKAAPPWEIFLRSLGDPNSIEYLLVADKNTTGLKGDVNPKTAHSTSNFKNFFFTLGHTKETGGGAFGLGRNVFFRASLVNTIFVYTRFNDDDGTVRSRFMGMTAANHYRHLDINYTGRHWWASEVRDDVVLPFEGNTADQLAEAFSMNIYTEGETGTAVMVLKPNVDNLDSLPSILRGCAEIYTWPHVIEKRVKFRFTTSQNIELDAIRPTEARSVVRGFAEAYLSIRQPQMYLGYNRLEIYFRNYKAFEAESDFKGLSKTLGIVSSRNKSIASSLSTQETEARGLPNGSSIALMRSARIIVQYFPVPEPSAEESVQGVFVASEEWDQVFRKSENLTHDEWEHTRLDVKSGKANPVKVLFYRLKEIFTPKGGLEWDNTKATEADQALGDDLGQLVIGLEAGGRRRPEPTGKVDPTGGTGGGGAPARLVLTLESNRPIASDDNFVTRELKYEYKVAKAPEAPGEFTLTANVHASIGNGIRETEAPIGAPVPELESLSINGALSDLSKRITLKTTLATSKGELVFRVRVPKAIKASFEPNFKEVKAAVTNA
jgi:hypothetical protein